MKGVRPVVDNGYGARGGAKRGRGRKGRRKGGAARGERPRTTHPAVSRGVAVRGAIVQRSEFDDILSCRALGPADNVKFNPFPFFERFESLALNGGMVDKNVLAAILLDKTESLGIVKPFYRTFCHCRSSLCRKTYTLTPYGIFFEWGLYF